MAEKKKNKGGRPKKKIDYELVEKLASIMCTQEEIANFINISTRTLQRDDEFCRIYIKGIENGKTSLRRDQFKSSRKGKVAMQIWLGKQYLDQKDKQEVESNTNGTFKFVIDNDDANA